MDCSPDIMQAHWNIFCKFLKLKNKTSVLANNIQRIQQIFYQKNLQKTNKSTGNDKLPKMLLTWKVNNEYYTWNTWKHLLKLQNCYILITMWQLTPAYN